MPRACNVRDQSVYQFCGARHIAREPSHAQAGQPRRSRAWPMRFLSSKAGSGREYVVVHDEEPLAFHTTLYALKKGHMFTVAQLELHARSQIDLWTEDGSEGHACFLSLTGFEQERTPEVQWVIQLCGTEEEANTCLHKVRGLVRRLSRLDREFRLGGSVKLYTDPDHPNQPVYKSKVEWLLGTASPLAEPLLQNDLHCYGIVPRRAELTSPLIDACFSELLASLESYSLRKSLPPPSSACVSESADVSPLRNRARCGTAVQEHTVPPAVHRRGSWMGSMPFAST